MRTLPYALAALGALGSGCLATPRSHVSYVAQSGVIHPPSYVIYQDSSGPLSYQAPVAKDAGQHTQFRRVQGKACQVGLQLPIAGLRGITWLSVAVDDGSYRDALAAAQAKAPNAVLFDIRADLNARTIFLIYREECLIVDAAVVDRAPT